MSSYGRGPQHGRRLVMVIIVLGGVMLITMVGSHTKSQLTTRNGYRYAASFGGLPVAPVQLAEPTVDTTRSVFTYKHPALISTGRKSTIRANLNPANKYLLSFAHSGFTNQVMELINHIHIAHLSNHIPILPPVIGHISHLHGHVPLMHVREFFDLSELEDKLGMPILELLDLKAVRETEVGVGEELPHDESIPCWGLMQTQTRGGGLNVNIRDMVREFHLGLLRTPLPEELYRGIDALYEPVARFLQPSMAESYVSPPSRKMRTMLDQWNEPMPSIFPQPLTDPLSCMDGLYYMASESTNHGCQEEYYWAGSVWKDVGVHMKFTDEWERRTKEVERKILGLAKGDEIPVFHAMHIRHGDRLGERCADPHLARSDRGCLPVSNYVPALNENLQQLLRAGQLEWQGTEKVLVLSDDTSDAFKEQVKDFGFVFVDHDALKTFETYGPWGSTVIDSVLMTHAKALVGSEGSTMSILGARRGEDWYGNVHRLA